MLKLLLEFSLNFNNENVLQLICVKLWSECQSQQFKLKYNSLLDSQLAVIKSIL